MDMIGPPSEPQLPKKNSVDLDGKAEVLVGTHGGAVLHYALAQLEERAAEECEAEANLLETLFDRQAGERIADEGPTSGPNTGNAS